MTVTTATCRDCDRTQLVADMEQDGTGAYFCKLCWKDGMVRLAVLVDRDIAAAHQAVTKAQATLVNRQGAVMRGAGARLVWQGRRSEWNMTFENALEAVTKLAAEDATWRGRDAMQTVGDYARAADAVREARQALDFQNKRYQGWSRFFLVTDGHIHSNMGCHSCRITTEFGWLPELSGLGQADAVAAHGALLCTFCFPDAPVEFTNGLELAAQAKKDAQCPGSGKFYDPSLPYRKGYSYGNWAQCPDCAAKPALTSTGKLRAHKREV